MLIGYARVSTVEQDAGFEAQERDLKAAGAERLFSERTSAVGPRKALDEAIDFAREGDAIVVTKLDRLARSVADLVRIVREADEEARRAAHPGDGRRHCDANWQARRQRPWRHRAV